MDIIQALTGELQVQRWQVEAAVKLIDEGNTIPFISRYRKEATGSLNDEVLRNLHERLIYLRNLEEKKTQVLSSIREQEKLTPELEKAILEAQTLVVVEDLYRPYRPKRRTRATIAKEKGLEPLANIIALQMTDRPLSEEAEPFVSEEKGVANVQEALAGAMDILAETVSDEAGIFQGKTFVITGSLERFSNRKELQELIESLGGKAAGSVSAKTSYLINNDTASSSSKNKKAKELGIPILSEADFLKLVEEEKEAAGQAESR